MHKLIVITLPDFIPDEARSIVRMLGRGDIDLIHIRKPNGTEAEVATLIEEVLTLADVKDRLVLHDHHRLALRYGLFGIHLNGRCPLPPQRWTGSVSRSCHTLAEVLEWKTVCDYVSLSPIFDSISKTGYKSAFTSQELQQAVRRGIIDQRVLALGGVTFDRLHEVQDMGFGGAMILGDAWKNEHTS